MCCTLHEEPTLELEEDFVRLAPATTFAEANERCLALLQEGLRCRVVMERLGHEADGALVPVIHVLVDDLHEARAQMAKEWRRTSLRFPGRTA